MDDKTLQALTAIANKLGTTAEYLWGVLLKQAPISATVDLLLIVAWIAGTAMIWSYVSKKSKEWHDDAGVFVAWMCVALLVVFGALMIVLSASNIAAALFNPEYWALKQILKN